MLPRADIIAVIAMALVATGSAFGSDNNALVIKGKVMGEDGKPQPDSEIHVKRVDTKGPEIIAVTDSHGKYIVTGLVVGDYTVKAYDPNGFARSRALIKTDRKGWAKVDFDLALANAGDGPDRLWQGGLHGHLTSASSHFAPIPAHR